MGSNGPEEAIKGVDLGCGLRRAGVRVGMKYINPLEPGVAFSQLLFRGLQGLWCTSFRSSRHLVM